MSDLILHHYPASLFSEKVRALMGYKQQAYKGVTIPVIMPKPDLMPLTGGYRKTPVLQVGADIYCDTSLICKVIDRHFPEPTIYPEALEAAAGAIAHWTDTFLFKVSVALVFQPKAMSTNTVMSDPAAAQAFISDRAELSKGSTELRLDPKEALPYWQLHMKRLDRQLSNQDFMFGDMPNIADFSTYHCVWFVHNNEALRDLVDSYPNVERWRQAMQAFGNGELTEISGTEALDIAKNSQPDTLPKKGGVTVDDIELGEEVEVMPIDYGFQPTRGTLLVSSLEEIAVLRTDEQVGEIAVHFPRLGFQVNRAS